MDQASTATATIERTRARAGKYLTFFLADEEYGIEILKVHEILKILPITRVPRTPAFLRGVINLRGTVIPIVDLRAKFDMQSEPDGVQTCIIVVHVHGHQTGLVVDRVSEVLDIAESGVENPPSFGSDVDTDFLLGIAKSHGRVRLLLDIDCVLSPAEAAELRAGEAGASQAA